jgi:hypothetical protein
MVQFLVYTAIMLIKGLECSDASDTTLKKIQTYVRFVRFSRAKSDVCPSSKIAFSEIHFIQFPIPSVFLRACFIILIHYLTLVD